jgi:hypothetical protein
MRVPGGGRSSAGAGVGGSPSASGRIGAFSAICSRQAALIAHVRSRAHSRTHVNRIHPNAPQRIVRQRPLQLQCDLRRRAVIHVSISSAVVKITGMAF